MNLNTFWLLLYLFSSIFSLNAQLQFGAKVGCNYNKLGNPDGKNSLSGLGYHIGVFTEHRLNNNLFGLVEISFSQKVLLKRGSSITITGDVFTYDESMKYNYLDVPLLLSFRRPKGIQFYLGPEFSLLIGGKSAGTVSNFDGVNEVRIEYVVSGDKFRQGLAPILLGARIGMGYNIKSGLCCSLMYQRSISSWYKSSSYFNLVWNTIFASIVYKFDK